LENRFLLNTKLKAPLYHHLNPPYFFSSNYILHLRVHSKQAEVPPAPYHTMAELNAKQMRQLLQSISTDPQLKQSKDTILLAEDQYPVILDAIFTRLITPTSLQNTINLLQWDRRAGKSYDAELKATTVASQNYM
jgi:hypothetical protein